MLPRVELDLQARGLHRKRGGLEPEDECGAPFTLLRTRFSEPRIEAGSDRSVEAFEREAHIGPESPWEGIERFASERE